LIRMQRSLLELTKDLLVQIVILKMVAKGHHSLARSRSTIRSEPV